MDLSTFAGDTPRVGAMSGLQRIHLLPLTESQHMLLTSLIEFALDRYEDNRFPLVEGYIVRLRELQALVARGEARPVRAIGPTQTHSQQPTGDSPCPTQTEPGS